MQIGKQVEDHFWQSGSPFFKILPQSSAKLDCLNVFHRAKRAILSKVSLPVKRCASAFCLQSKQGKSFQNFWNIQFAQFSRTVLTKQNVLVRCTSFCFLLTISWTNHKRHTKKHEHPTTVNPSLQIWGKFLQAAADLRFMDRNAD